MVLVVAVTEVVVTGAGAGAGEAAGAGRTRRKSGSHAQSLAVWCNRCVITQRSEPLCNYNQLLGRIVSLLVNCMLLLLPPGQQFPVMNSSLIPAVAFDHQLQGKIKSLEQIYLFSMPVKEYQIVEYFLGSALKDEVMKIMPVQKQTRAGQRTRFKVGPECQQHSCGIRNKWRIS